MKKLLKLQKRSLVRGFTGAMVLFLLVVGVALILPFVSQLVSGTVGQGTYFMLFFEKFLQKIESGEDVPIPQKFKGCYLVQVNCSSLDELKNSKLSEEEIWKVLNLCTKHEQLIGISCSQALYIYRPTLLRIAFTKTFELKGNDRVYYSEDEKGLIVLHK